MNMPQHAKLRDFENLCRERGLPMTVQRRVILEAVVDREDHPTADQVYQEVVQRLPGLSRTTVYRVLDMLVQMGLITKVCHPGAAVRFDPRTHRHHHLVCMKCGRMMDLEDERMNALPLPKVNTHGFQISDFSIHFRGVCADCRRTAVKRDSQVRRSSENNAPGPKKPPERQRGRTTT